MTEVPLREYLEAVMAEREKRTTQLERDAKDALKLATEALEKRLDLLNEFRSQSKDEQERFAQKTEVKKLEAELERIIRDHVPRREFELVRTTQSRMIGALILFGVLIPVASAVAGHYLA